MHNNEIFQNIEGRIDVYEEFGLNTTVLLTVSRSVGFFGPVTVTWQAEPREATILDFYPSSGTLSLADTQDSGHIEITIVDDTIPEDMEVCRRVVKIPLKSNTFYLVFRGSAYGKKKLSYEIFIKCKSDLPVSDI